MLEMVREIRATHAALDAIVKPAQAELERRMEFIAYYKAAVAQRILRGRP